jgi:rRNA pseudouridine-1189 N-methylase Emg1 (Nep1/Mra1 family)
MRKESLLEPHVFGRSDSIYTMVVLLLADTDLKPKSLHDVESMCHAIGLNIIIHYKDEELEDVLDLVDSPIVTFSPNGHISLDKMIDKYGGDVLLVVGGFEEDKDFESDVYSHAKDVVSLGPEFLTIPQVIETIIKGYEKKSKRRSE